MNIIEVNGEQISFLRQEIFKLTQGDVATQLGMSQSSISSIEIGRVKPSLLLVLIFAIAGNTSPYWVMSGHLDESHKRLLFEEFNKKETKPIDLVKSKHRAEKVISFLPKRLRVAREEADISQRKLAVLVGLSQSNISDLERGVTTPTCELIGEFDGIFNINVNVDVLLAYNQSSFSLAYNDWGSRSLAKLISIQLKEIDKLETDNTDDHFTNLSTNTSEKNINQDNDLVSMIRYLQQLYTAGDQDIKSWVKVQFQRAFPDYKKWLSEKRDSNNYEPVSKNTDVICNNTGQVESSTIATTNTILKEQERNDEFVRRRARNTEIVTDPKEFDNLVQPVRRRKREL